MQGQKIEQARGALRMCLSFLNPTDRFGLIAFSDSVDPWRSYVMDATPDNLAEALAFVDRMEANGGTDIQASLIKALEVAKPSGRPRAIIFLTDGQPTSGVTNAEAILQAVRDKNPQGTRIFVFGVGGDVNRVLLERLALANRGIDSYVREGETIDQKVSSFYAKIAKPVLADLALDFDHITTAMVYPAVLPDIYKGQQLIISGRFRGNGETDVVLAGLLNGQRRAYPFAIDFPLAQNDNAFVARLWAKRRVDYLLSQIRTSGERPELKDEVIRLAKAYTFVTPYTSFVAKADRPQTATLSPARIKPGDPEITVRAPEDARSVTLIFPFGLVKAAKYDRRQGRWVARFLIPQGTPEGVYFVEIVVVQRNGAQARARVSYTVDTQAPVMTAQVDPPSIRPGATITIAARPQTDLMEAMDTARRARSARNIKSRLQSLVDVKRVEAAVPGMGVVPLTLGKGGWAASTETPSLLAPGTYDVTVTAVDVAGNAHSVVVPFTVEP